MFFSKVTWIRNAVGYRQKVSVLQKKSIVVEKKKSETKRRELMCSLHVNGCLNLLAALKCDSLNGFKGKY